MSGIMVFPINMSPNSLLFGVFWVFLLFFLSFASIFTSTAVLAAGDDIEQFNQKIYAQLDQCEVKAPPPGGLLSDPSRLQDAIRRFREMGKPAEELIALAHKLIDNPEIWSQIDATPYYCLREFATVYEAAAVRGENVADFATVFNAAAVSGDEALRDFTCKLILRMLAAETWVAPVHYPMTYDHCTANVASEISQALDRIGGDLPEAWVQDVRNRLRDKFLALFVNTWENQLDVWSKHEYVENWKIMTCGETGLGVIYCWDGSDLSRRALRGCVAGVLQILGTLPETGEYQEGFGYWLTTMNFGLRFAAALRQATDGKVDLLQHPRLNATASFLLNLCQSDGSVFNWGDNSPKMSVSRMMMLGSELKRGDILYITRKFPVQELDEVIYDDLSVKSEPPTLTSAIYRHNQLDISVFRTGWDENATFAAFKCGKAKIGHGHLDQNSFIITRGKAHLAIDQGIWPYAHFLGYFGLWTRWNFDATSSFGHNGILVDGQGQKLSDQAGKIEAYHFSDRLDYVVGQAVDCYDGKLTNFRRWFIWAKPDFFLVVDRLESEELRNYEWVFQHRGNLENAPPDPARYLPPSADSPAGIEQIKRFKKTYSPLSPVPRSVVNQDGESLTIDMIYPSSYYGVRVADVRRQSFYTESDWLQPVEPYVQYRSYSPLNTAKHMTFVVGMYVGKPQQITMKLVSDDMIRSGSAGAEAYDVNILDFSWPEKPIPSPIVEFTITGQPPQRISLDEENLTVRLD